MMDIQRTAVLVATVLAGSSPLPVLAQAADLAAAAAPGAQQEAATNQLQDIVVTATRRAANIQDVPIAISVVSQAGLNDLNVSQTTDLPRLVPGLNFTGGSVGNSTSFVLRGVSTFANSEALESSVGIALDGVPLGRTVGSINDLVDVARIEVLKGPQGTLFGKNSTAGVISIVTAEPQFDTTADARVYYGTRDELRMQGTANFQLINDKLAIRLSGWRFRHDGYIDAPNLNAKQGDLDTYGGRIRVRYDPTPDLKLNYVFQATHQDDTSLGLYQYFGYVGITLPAAQLSDAQIASARASQIANLSAGVVAGPANYATSIDSPYNHHQTSANHSFQADWQIGGATLTSLTSWQHSKYFDVGTSQTADVPATFATPVNNQFANVHQFTQEVRIASAPDDFISYVAGAFYFNLDSTSGSDLFALRLLPFPVGRTTRPTVHAENYAAFGEATLHASQALRFIAGGRLAHDDIAGTYVRTIPSGAVAVPNSGFGTIDVASRSRYTNFSGRLGVQYDVADRTHAYATFSQGYKGPGLAFTIDLTIPQFQLTQAKVKPEVVDSYEAGIKSELFDRTLRINLSAYYSIYRDFQASSALATVPLSFQVINANELVAKGAEAEVSWKPAAGVTIDGNIAYSGAKFTDFTNAPCYQGQAFVTTANPAPGTCNGTIQNANGAPLPNAPRWSGNLTGRYDGAIRNVRFFGQANVYYKGPVYYSIGRDPNLREKAFALLNVTAGVRSGDDRYGLTFYGKNVFDRHFTVRKLGTGGSAVGILPYESLASYGLAVDARF